MKRKRPEKDQILRFRFLSDFGAVRAATINIIINIAIASWAVLAVAITGAVVVPLALDLTGAML